MDHGGRSLVEQVDAIVREAHAERLREQRVGAEAVAEAVRLRAENARLRAELAALKAKSRKGRKS